MSKTVDERIVQMQFDNQQFERNVQTSVSTLDKLKESLNFTGASKSFDNLSASAKNVDMSGLSGSIETVKSKFSAMEIIGVTALVNITNSAVDAGKRMLSALTIEPVTTGFNEYELKMDSVKTIMASTGESVEKVNEYLEELNEYSDQTIYSFADMTQNIGKFTNAGVKLEDAVLAIKGISNEAAVSGANAQEASRAMYNFAQALSAGYVKLIDWKSIENANMATMEFKQQLIDTAVEMGTVIKVGDMYKSTTTNAKGEVSDLFNATKMFNDTLNNQWMTTEVLTGTLKKYADANTEIGKKAFAAAQDVTKFTQVFDILKETAQSGWSKTWELLIGDIDQAKALLTPLTNFLSGIIDGMSDFRNNLLEGALGNPFAKMFEGITSKLDKLKTAGESVEKLTGSLEYYQDVVNKVWHGDYKNADTGRYGFLEDDGYDHRIVQDLVNKGLGYKLTVEDILESQRKFGVSVSDTADAAGTMAVTLENLSDEQLKNAGLTAEEIALYRQLAEESKRTGKSIEELLAEMSKKDGRTLLIESFQNAGQGLVAVLKAVKDAWVEIFPPMTSIQLYNIIAGLNSFSENLRVSDEKADKLKRTLKGVFAIIDIIATITGGAFRIAFKVLTAVLGAFDLDILDVTAAIGDAIVRFRDWIKSGLDMTGVVKKIVPYVKTAVVAFVGWIKVLKESGVFAKVGSYIKTAASAFVSWIKAIKQSGVFGKLAGYIKTAASAFVGWIKALKQSDNIPRDIILGLVNGLKSGIKAVGSVALNLAKKIVETVKDFLGIHSPARKFIEIGEYIILGLIEGVKSGFSAVASVFTSLASKCIEIIKGIDFGNVFAAVVTTGLVIASNKVGSFLVSFGSMFEGLGDLFEGVGVGMKRMFTGIGKSFKASALEKKSKALLNFAIAIGILAAVVVILAKIGTDGMWGAVSVVAALTAIMIGLAFALSKLSATLSGAAEIGIIGATLTAIAGSLLIMTIVMKIIGGMDGSDIAKGIGVIAGFTGIIAALVLITKLATAKDMKYLSKVLKTMTSTMLTFTLLIVVIGWMSEDKLAKGIGVIAAFTGIIAALMLTTKLMTAKDMKSLSSVLKSMSTTMLMFTVVIMLVGGMSDEKLGKGLGAIAAFTAIISGLLLATKLMTAKDMKALGSTLIGMAAAMLVLGIVLKMVSSIEAGSLVVGILAITALSVIMAILTKSISGTKDVGKISSSLLAMSVAIGILAGIAVLLGFVSVDHLAKGIIAVGLLGAIMVAMIYSTKGASDCKANLIVMTVAIGVLAAAIAALSFIDPVSLATSAGALTAVIGAFALLIKSSSSMKKGSKNVLVMALTLGLVVAEIAIILAIMSECNAEGTINTALAISTVLLAMSGALLILSKIHGDTTEAIASMAILGLVVAELGIILGILSAFNVNPSIEMVSAISIMLLGMSATLAVLSAIGSSANSSYYAMGALAALIAVIGTILVALGALCEYVPAVETFLDKGIVVLSKIGEGLGKFVGSIIGGIGIGITSGLPEIGENIAKFSEQLASVDSKALDGATNAAGALLALSGAALVEGLSQLLGGDSISEFSEQLIPLGENIVKFSNILTENGGIDTDAVDAAANAGKMIASFASDIPNSGGVLGFIMGENDMDDFAAQMVPFAMSIVTFSTMVKGKVDGEAVENAARAGSMIASFASDIPNSGGVLGFIMGDNDMDDFSAQMVPFAVGITSFSTIVKGRVDGEAVEAATNAGLMIAGMAKEIPNSGGVLGFIMGDNDMDDFGKQLVPFGLSLIAFSSIVKGNIDLLAVAAASFAGEMMAALGSDIPVSGGVVGWIMGDRDLGKFGTQIVAFGKGITEFSNTVKGNIDNKSVEAATAAGNSLTALANSIPASDGAWDNFTEFFSGSDDIDGFMDQFVSFGEGIVAFSKQVKGIDTYAVNAAASAGEAILGFLSLAVLGETPIGESLMTFFGNGNVEGATLSSFGLHIASFGTSLKNFSTEVKGNVDQTAVESAMSAASSIFTGIKETPPKSDIDDMLLLCENIVDFAKKVHTFAFTIDEQLQPRVTAACASVAEVVEMAKGTTDVDVDTFTMFSAALGCLATDGVRAFATTFENAHERVKTAVKDFIDAAKKAAENKATSFTNAFTKLFDGVITAIEGDGTANNTGYLTDFYDAGVYLVDGFAAGIDANTFKAEAAASAMASAAIDAAKTTLDTHSPSKVFYGIGDNAGAGFVNALTDYAPISYKAASSMADSARKGLTWAVSRIADAVENDIDTQPTIRPVLDLSNIKAGAGSIGGMLSVDARAVGRISASMSGIQNGPDNSDIVTAINKLRKDIVDNPRTVNNINGVTYDDGSNIVSAVESIVRYATIEGRSK